MATCLLPAVGAASAGHDATPSPVAANSAGIFTTTYTGLAGSAAAASGPKGTFFAGGATSRAVSLARPFVVENAAALPFATAAAWRS